MKIFHQKIRKKQCKFNLSQYFVFVFVCFLFVFFCRDINTDTKKISFITACFCKRAEKFMVLFLGYVEERWRYLVNQEKKKKGKKNQ